MRTFSFLLLAAALLPGVAHADTERPPPPVMAVLPIAVTGRAALMDAGPLLSAALAAKLADLGKARVITSVEVEALLQAESERQALGARDDGALLEAAGAMGAEAMVVGNIADVGAQLVWNASLVKTADSTTLQRVQVLGKSLGSLLARVDEVALGLLGRSSESRLQGKKAQAMLGLDKKEDLKTFREYREAHPESSMPEAFTEFIKTRNIESVRLAAVEAGTFTLGSALLFAGASTWLMAMLVTASIPLAPLGLIPLACGPFLCIGGLASWAVGIGAFVMDVVNRGQVKVHADGCCRDDAKLAEEDDARDGPLRAAALTILLTGPAFALAGFSVLTLVSVVGFAYGLMAAGTGARSVSDLSYVTSPAYTSTSSVFGLSYVPSLCACLLPCVASPVGLVLLFLPSPPVVERARKRHHVETEEEL